MTTGHVIAVDLDGTLTLTDTLHESAMLLLRDRPLDVLSIPIWLLGGKANLKAKVADKVALNPHTLPYNELLITWLKEQKASGRRLALCSATDQRVANSIAQHLDIFDDVIASDGETNVAGKNKRAALEKEYGVRGYDYAGNSSADIDVWTGARKAIVVNAPANVSARANKIAEVEKSFPPTSIPLSMWRKVLRVHQWMKNLLLFVPLLAAHQFTNLHLVSTLILAFISFSLCASSVYITNDLLDLESDRQHPRKRFRPFSSGVVPIKFGVMLAPLLAIISLAFACAVGLNFTACLITYFLLTTAYSVNLKRHALIDCMTLAGLYTMRIIAGAAATALPLSFWLLAFSIFIFLSLAFVKRYAELQMQAEHGKNEVHGRGYVIADAPLVHTLGITSGYASVLVLALYLNSDTVATLYKSPQLIWGAIPLMLFWVSWVWLKAHRGQMHDDPVVFALKDKTSLVVAALIAICFGLATLVRGFI